MQAMKVEFAFLAVEMWSGGLISPEALDDAAGSTVIAEVSCSRPKAQRHI